MILSSSIRLSWRLPKLKATMTMTMTMTNDNDIALPLVIDSP